MTAEYVSETAGKHAGSRGGLIAILQDIQGRYGYLPAEALKAVAAQTGRPLVDVHGVATFYHSFSLKPRGKHLCSACLGTACHVRGGPVIAREFERVLDATVFCSLRPGPALS
jgi:NADH:ubiquinone oxidoreductase subunit E